MAIFLYFQDGGRRHLGFFNSLIDPPSWICDAFFDFKSLA